MFLPQAKQNKNEKDTWKFWEVSDMPITLIIVVVFAYIQMPQIVDIKYVNFFMDQLYLKKLFKKTKVTLLFS